VNGEAAASSESSENLVPKNIFSTSALTACIPSTISSQLTESMRHVDQPYMANGFGRGARLFTGSLDTISEFKVQTSDYGAEYGRAAGSYVNIVTRSGTNDFHGSVFEYFRDHRRLRSLLFERGRSSRWARRVRKAGVSSKTCASGSYEGCAPTCSTRLRQ
jgi:hypothetical protein